MAGRELRKEEELYAETQKEAELRRAAMNLDIVNREKNKEVFEAFIADLGSAFGKFVQDWIRAGRANVEALSGAVGQLAGEFAVSRIPLKGMGLGMFADPLSGIIGGLVGAGLTRLFGSEKALEIDGTVDVNIVDIQANAADFFSFRGFEGFTFTSRFKTVFESGLY